MNKKNIFFISGTIYPSQTGGPDNSTFWLAQHLTKLNYEVLIISFYKNIKLSDIRKYQIVPNKISNIDGVKILFCKYTWIRLLSFSFWSYIFSILKIKKKYFVVTNSFFLFSNIILVFLFKKKLILSPRGELEIGAISNKLFIKKLYISFFSNYISRNILFYHFTSILEKDYANNLIKINNYKILPNYIPEYFNNKYLNLVNNNRFNFIYLGRLQEKKNIDILIKAYSKLSPKIKIKHNLLIVGEGSKHYTSYLKDLVSKNNGEKFIKFLGKKYSPEKEILLSHSRCLILISKSENWGNVIVESLSVGTPVIISSTNPWNELNNRCGYVISISEDDLYLNLLKIINLNTNDYLNFVNNSRGILKSFYLSQNIDKIDKFFN